MPILGLVEEVTALAEDIFERAANALMDDLIENAPVDTGELRDSAYGPVIDGDGLSAVIGFSAPQADWTDEGVQPHEIHASNAPVLTFYWDNGPNGPGVYHYDMVNHPGQEGTGWFSDRVDDWDDYVDEVANGD